MFPVGVIISTYDDDEFTFKVKYLIRKRSWEHCTKN